ncbi:MAG: PstS family phosphate ABC transporter substrate-binding protein [Myxacorys chilensis ATA2-1-KO14]|jgi:phosphate transport system substrate-binding protein|nr:PstS family phosphate ABC transporter substrate-binding protein [Myxacorys chilensis ATA2-1-KO14]
MSQKNETPALIASLLVTAGLLGGAFWWFTQRSGNFGVPIVQSSTPASKSDTASNSGQSTNSGQLSSGTFAQVQNVPSGLFRYGGSTSWAPIRLAVDGALQAARPEYRLQYTEPTTGSPGSGTGIKALIDGNLAFAQSSRPVSDEEYQRAQIRKLTLKQITIAIDGLAVAVNPSLNVPGLSVEQLKRIYTGQIDNWQQVGGPNLPITPISRSAESGGTVELFVEEVLGGQALSRNVQIVGTTTEALRQLGATPGGIYFASAPEVVPQCSIKPLPIGRSLDKLVPPYQEPLTNQCSNQRNQLNTPAFQSGKYPLTRNLFVIVKQDGGIEQQAGEAYANLLLSEQGQELVAKAGFVRSR